ncbi:hypothetical protein XELAEV_18001624mg [Xenopus laevis]|nr:hypothetical protein XELAEV_18001624mg [Xenopus laevis]
MEPEKMIEYIMNFSLDNCALGNQGYKRILLQLFGYTGHGKSSFINSCKYVMDGGQYTEYAKVAESKLKPKTMIRHSYQMTRNVTLVDNRGAAKMNKMETGEMYLQLGNFVPLDEPVTWQTGFDDMMKRVLASEKQDCADFIVPIFVHNASLFRVCALAPIRRYKSRESYGECCQTDRRKRRRCLSPHGLYQGTSRKFVQESGTIGQLEEGERCNQLAGNTNFSKRIQKSISQKKVSLSAFACAITVFCACALAPIGRILETLSSVKVWLELPASLNMGIDPAVIITHESSVSPLTKVKEKFRKMGARNIFTLDNYTNEDNMKTRGKHTAILLCLYESLKDVEFRMKQELDPIQERIKRKEFLISFAHNRELQKQKQEFECIKFKERQEREEREKKTSWFGWLWRS